jgi:ABC-2 type transport system permease protein
MTESPKPAGTIHDLGYKRYVGTRRPPSTRWRAIMRHQIATAWKKWWRYKMPLFWAVVTMFIAGGYMYVFGGRLLRGFGAGSGDLIVTLADSALPLSIPFFCRVAFMLTLTLGATIVAADTQSGAFTFYYVRSIKPIDYVLGKLAGFGILVASLVLVPPVLLALFRLGMCEDWGDVIAHLHLVPQAFVVGLLATLAYTAMPLALSSLVGNRRYALALWAAYYLIFGHIALGLSLVIHPGLAALDIAASMQIIAYELFDVHPLLRKVFYGQLSFEAAVIGVLAQSTLAILILWYQVSRDQKTGVGGTS